MPTPTTSLSDHGQRQESCPFNRHVSVRRRDGEWGAWLSTLIAFAHDVAYNGVVKNELAGNCAVSTFTRTVVKPSEYPYLCPEDLHGD